jgi:hypothetical protein
MSMKQPWRGAVLLVGIVWSCDNTPSGFNWPDFLQARVAIQ